MLSTANDALDKARANEALAREANAAAVNTAKLDAINTAIGTGESVAQLGALNTADNAVYGEGELWG